MQKLRPHFHKSVSELQQVFDVAPRDRARLYELLLELRHRASPTAQALQRRVEAALRRLPPEAPMTGADRTAGGAGPSPSPGPRPNPNPASGPIPGHGPVHGRPGAAAMPATLQIRCRHCQVALRVAVRAPCAVYGCPRCRGEFEASWRDTAFQIEWQPAAGASAAADAPMTDALARQILAVRAGDDAQAIKRAWRRASQHYHPDKHERLPERLRQAAESEIKRINAAYEHLVRGEAQRVASD